MIRSRTSLEIASKDATCSIGVDVDQVIGRLVCGMHMVLLFEVSYYCLQNTDTHSFIRIEQLQQILYSCYLGYF
jgi:hypothetical protein